MKLQQVRAGVPSHRKPSKFKGFRTSHNRTKPSDLGKRFSQQ